MALDPTIFKDFSDLNKGDRVKFVMKHDLSGGQGTIESIWMGIEEMCTIVVDGGGRVNSCRNLGDTVEKICH